MQHFAWRPSSIRGATVALLTILSLGLGSCGVGVFTRSLFGETLDIDVSVDEVANNEYPLAIEVVYVYDDQLLQQLLKMSAKDWFQHREQMRNDYPGTSAFESWEWEMTAGQRQTVHIPLRGSALAGIMFVNYYSDGAHRVRIPIFRDINVSMGFSDFTVKPG